MAACQRVTYAAISLLLFALFAAPAVAQRSFVDDAGRTIVLPHSINRVMAAGPPASVLLYAIAPDKMVGWVSAPTEDQKAFIAEPYRDLPAHGRVTGRGGTANVEAILAAKPDLIVDVGTVGESYASLADRVQQQTGIPYVLINGRFKQSSETLRRAGELLDVGERAEELASYAENSIARINSLMATIPDEQTPKVYYGRGPNGLETGLAGSINMEVLEAVGAKNVAQSAGAGGLANVSVEQVLSWNPDVILALDKAFFSNVRTDPLWSGISAVKAGRIFRAPTLPFGWFDAPPGINRVIGVSWLATVLYPDRTKIDLKQETRDFYRLFYHVSLTDDQVASLLSDLRVNK
jgi:iron complex transport system substrate-binding protein